MRLDPEERLFPTSQPTQKELPQMTIQSCGTKRRSLDVDERVLADREHNRQDEHWQ